MAMSWKEEMWQFLKAAQTPVGGIFVISTLILIGFVILVFKMNKDSPFAPYALPLVGLMVTVPAVMFMSVLGRLDAQAVAAIFGAIVAYLFAAKKE